MEKIGIICEYNPFHNGHLYHINKIKSLYPDSLIILIVNGYFLQRGEISLLSKYAKTKIALKNNVDIVIELPTLFGTQSADTFAYTSVYLLNKLKVNKIIFGSEKNDITFIKKVVDNQTNPTFDLTIKSLLDQGINYPTALSRASGIKEEILSNDLLGISYVKAIKEINPSIIPETILRTNNYLDNELESEIVSASNIRNRINQNENISKYVPRDVLNYINPINYELFFKLLKHTILTNDNLNEILDVNEGIENRLKKEIIKSNNINDFISKIKTKRYTFNRLNRMFIHILLNIKKIDAKENISYLKILGFNKKGQNYLNSIKKDLDISLNPSGIIYQTELKSSLLYDLLTNQNTYDEEISNKPIIY